MDRSQLVLRAWEAVSTERELQGVLEAVTDVVLPGVPYDSVGIIAFQGPKHDLYALHIVEIPHRKGETLAQFLDREVRHLDLNPPLEKPLIPYNPVALQQAARAGIPHVCNDLEAKPEWWEHEFDLWRGGVRAYATVPLRVGERIVGAAAFSRTKPLAFTEEQIATLSAVSAPLAVAVSNALANEEIRNLRDQLEAENTALREQLGQAPWFEDIVGDSPPVRAMLEAVEQVAPTDATVLITGETGTGKELIARAIHRRSGRAKAPLVKVNCAAIPDTLLPSELFGHERGAFTGAIERRKGRFEQAHGGTLLLDEIAEMPPETQVMLLRVLQEREFERLGGNHTVQVDVRVVAATNGDLEEQVRAGRFRSDLYYRLNVFPVRIPPLRERIDDIPLLVAHFAARYGERFQRPITHIDTKTLQAMKSYAWPGNIRELENVVERAVILSRHGRLRLEREALPAGVAKHGIDAELRDQERGAIEAALTASKGRISGANGAARRLGLPASTLEFRIKRLGIDKFSYR